MYHNADWIWLLQWTLDDWFLSSLKTWVLLYSKNQFSISVALLISLTLDLSKSTPFAYELPDIPQQSRIQFTKFISLPLNSLYSNTKPMTVIRKIQIADKAISLYEGDQTNTKDLLMVKNVTV